MAADIQSILSGPAFAGGGFSRNEEASSYADNNSAPSMYWRKPDGSIHLLKAGLNGADRMYTGSVPLQRYGMVTRATREQKTDNDEFSVLIERGGLSEFSAAQIFELHWHRRPSRDDTPTHKAIWRQVELAAVRGLSEHDAICEVMPQLTEAAWPEDVSCQYCFGRVFLSRADLHKHESVMHRDDVRTRELRDNISDALKSQAANQGDMAQVIQLLAQTMAAIGGQNAETKAMVQEILGKSIETSPKKRAKAEPVGSDEPNDDAPPW